jgi:hypothetical protein
MKRLVFVLSLALILLPVASSMAAGKKKAGDERIEKLEEEVVNLKEKLEKAESDKKGEASTNHPLKIYGLIVLNPTFATAKTTLYGTRNSAAALSSVKDKTANASDGNSWFGLTIQNSRLGIIWTGKEIADNVKASGLFEIDFVNIINNASYGTSPIPRIRHLSFTLEGKNWSILMGQNWDIFSPLNTNSLSIGNNLWYQGNLGFRRPQLRFTYNIPAGTNGKVNLAASVNHPSNTDDLYSGGMEGGIPYGEGLIQYTKGLKYGDLIVAVSGTGGTHRSNGKNKEMWGIAGSINIPLHNYLTLKGEVEWGKDLGDFLTFAGSTGGVKNLGGWGQISSKWHKKFETNIGYGIDDIKKTSIADGSVSRNQIAFGNFKYSPWTPFSIGVEYEYMRTTYKGHGASPAHVVFGNFAYSF